jgi:hypothetical protein
MGARFLAWAGLILAIVGTAAALVVVPEVRCRLGLSAPECAVDHGTSRDPDAVIDAIASHFERVESELGRQRYNAVRKDLTGVSGDSAYLTVYLSGSDIPKVRERVFHGGVRTVWQAYYRQNQLVFIYRTDSRNQGSGWVDFDQQRYYFDHGKLVRWLRGMDKRPIPRTSSEYLLAERTMGDLGTQLIEGARSPDQVVPF